MAGIAAAIVAADPSANLWHHAAVAVVYAATCIAAPPAAAIVGVVLHYDTLQLCILPVTWQGVLLTMLLHLFIVLPCDSHRLSPGSSYSCSSAQPLRVEINTHPDMLPLLMLFLLCSACHLASSAVEDVATADGV
jgi:hypothetical protein